MRCCRDRHRRHWRFAFALDPFRCFLIYIYKVSLPVDALPPHASAFAFEDASVDREGTSAKRTEKAEKAQAKAGRETIR
jgi:hypothetical protein